MRNFDFGIISLWFGSLASIPDGFALCDGTQGTPDLRNVFPRGAGIGFDPGEFDLTKIHNHDFTGDGHNHSIGFGSGLRIPGTDNSVLNTDVAIGTTDDGESLMPFHSLAYIMEI